jgi:hypothetical protein
LGRDGEQLRADLVGRVSDKLPVQETDDPRVVVRGYPQVRTRRRSARLSIARVCRVFSLEKQFDLHGTGPPGYQ